MRLRASYLIVCASTVETQKTHSEMGTGNETLQRCSKDTKNVKYYSGKGDCEKERIDTTIETWSNLRTRHEYGLMGPYGNGNEFGMNLREIKHTSVTCAAPALCATREDEPEKLGRKVLPLPHGKKLINKVSTT